MVVRPRLTVASSARRPERGLCPRRRRRAFLCEAREQRNLDRLENDPAAVVAGSTVATSRASGAWSSTASRARRAAVVDTASRRGFGSCCWASRASPSCGFCRPTPPKRGGARRGDPRPRGDRRRRGAGRSRLRAEHDVAAGIACGRRRTTRPSACSDSRSRSGTGCSRRCLRRARRRRVRDGRDSAYRGAGPSDRRRRSPEMPGRRGRRSRRATSARAT